MYSSRGGNYGQQPYSSQSGYGQNLGAGYPGSAAGGTEGGLQISLNSRHSSIPASSQENEIGGFRSHSSTTGHYGGQYASVYGSASLSATQQGPPLNAKVAGSSGLESHAGYASALPDSPKFASGSYIPSSSHGYGKKGDDIYPEKISSYLPVERKYGERQGGYIGRDLQTEPTGRYTDSSGFRHQHQTDLYDRIDHASLLRGEQLLKVQSLHTSSVDGGARQADYLSARSSSGRLSTQEALHYGGRMDSDPHSLSVLSASSYASQHGPSILGVAPRRNLDDLIYPESSPNPGYGVSLPPGRDYGAAGKGLHSTSLDLDYRGSMLPRGAHDHHHKDDRASYLREFELREEERRRENLRARDKDRERERIREREREREHERERERQRERERDRERERTLERREKERERERERERKRALETKRERTPLPRIVVPRDTRSSSLIRRDTPHREASHRRPSPVKQTRRDYVCKVSSSRLVDVERDYLSIDKRYPRLYISPEFSKVVVNWPKEDLKLPIHTAVSFEHGFAEDNVAGVKEAFTKTLAEELVRSGGNTVWNAKMILMSGLSRTALEDLSSDKVFEDRIPHICNILKFAVLKMDHSFMAIGGQWDPSDGNDPSVDDSSLVQTVLRYAKDTIQLNLQNCHNWNRFLEIHYDRVGEDGLFSHKEITVLFVPDLSECIPSSDAWRTQWLAHRKALADRECQLSLKKERSREKEEPKGKGTDSSKDADKLVKTERKKDSASSSANKGKSSSETKNKAAEAKSDGNEMKVEKKGGDETGEKAKNLEKMEQGDSAGAQTTGTKKTVKKKIIKRIVKRPVNGGKAGSKQNDKLDQKDVSEQNVKSETLDPEEEAVPTSSKKNVVEKVVAKTGQNEEDTQIEKKAETEMSEDKPSDNLGPSAKANKQKTPAKPTIKKKIIKRVPKRKATSIDEEEVGASKKDEGDSEKKLVEAEKRTSDADSKETETRMAETKTKSETPNGEKNENVSSLGMKAVKTVEDKMIEKKSNSESQSEGKKVNGNGSDDKKGKAKDSEKETKEKDGKDEAKSNSNKETKDKKKSEEPPRPGFILQTKLSKESKLRSLALSLDSLLDYNEKDIDESSFELSLFAESLFEMFQYQMGCRILAFLQKLRIKFVTKRNQRKRHQEEMSQKKNDAKSPTKRQKTGEHREKDISIKLESADQKDDKETTGKEAVENTQETAGKETVSTDNAKESRVNEAASVENNDEAMSNDEGDDDDYEEDPEEDPEENEEMGDASPEQDSPKQNEVDEKSEANADPMEVASDKKNELKEENVKEKSNVETAEMKLKPDGNEREKREGKSDVPKKEAVVDKELLQAFRFFDRNQVGYIRVEEMRLIIHNLGKFLSHREVKELVQSALLETNTGRDDRILYNKLVRMYLS